MHLTLILGDSRLNRRLAADRALALGRFRPSEVELIELSTQLHPEYGEHANPSFRVRLDRSRREWARALKRIRATSSRYVVIVTSAYASRRCGPELTFPIGTFQHVAAHVRKLGGTVEVVVLIDEVFDQPIVSAETMTSTLAHRHLEWTFAQYLGAQLHLGQQVRVHCFAANHPAQNLLNVIERSAVLAIYVCHPINAFRRDHCHPDRAQLDAFRRSLPGSMTLLDPLAIDEEVLISDLVGVQTDGTTIVPPEDRWAPVASNPILPQPEEWMSTGLELSYARASARHVGATAKAQVPERDFLWIDMCDVLVAWRPFLGQVHHAGVLAEIQYALHNEKRVLAYSPLEDGNEHPSPFASMVTVFSDLRQLTTRLSELARLTHSQGAPMAENLPKYCDHTSVGVLIYNDENELLLIERGTFPYGMAVPAGHVDQHSSYEEAAIAEVHEEVGLTIKDLRLVAEGRRENPCRRLHGAWHYWKIFEAKATGTISLSPREARRAEWCSPRRLVELGLVTLGDAEATSGLERVWLDWLTHLQIIHVTPPSQPPTSA